MMGAIRFSPGSPLVRERLPLMAKSPDRADPPAWKLPDAFETYGVKNWGKD